MNPLTTNKGVALALAVLHHGLSCLAERSIPSRAETVIETAGKFKEYLDKGNNQQRQGGRN